MTSLRQFARRRPSATGAPRPDGCEGQTTSTAETTQQPDALAGLGASTLLHTHLNASQMHASTAAARTPAQTPAAADVSGIDQGWRARLTDISQAVGLPAEQEAALERLAHAQQQRISEEIPRLLADLKPHFRTPGEAEAKRRYEAGLQALKDSLDAETDALLHSFGLAPPAD